MTAQDNRTATDIAGERYRFETLTTGMVVDDMWYGRNDLGPGDTVPAFDLPTTDGGRFTSSDLGTRPVLMIFGSRTCPITESAGPHLKALHEEYGSKTRFVMVNTREAHPGELITQPKTDEEKLEHAKALQSHHDLPFEVAVDDLDGTLHRAFSPKPNSAYLLDPEGRILYRAHWANDHRSLEPALKAAAEGREFTKGRSRAMFRPLMMAVGHLPAIVGDAGKKVERDVWRAAAPLALLARLSRPFQTLPTDRRGFAALGVLGLLTIAVLLGIVAIA